MTAIDGAFYVLARMAGISLVVLLAGAIVAWRCQRPIERLRTIQATFAALIVACLLQPFQVLPRISLAWLPADEIAESPATSDPTIPDVLPAEADPDAFFSANVNDLGIAPNDEPGDGTSVSEFPFGARRTPFQRMRARGRFGDGVAQESAIQPALAVAVPRWTIGQLSRAGVVAGFLAGAGWCVGLSILGAVRLRRLRAKSLTAPRRAVEMLATVKPANSRPVEVLVSDDVEVPLTFGVLRPVIVLPADLTANAPDDTLRYCLAHEWSHVARWDIAQWHLVQLLQPLVWFQPCYWWLRRELRIAQDQLADHFAATAAADPIPYAELLLELAKIRLRASLPMALTMSDGQSSVARRIALLLSNNLALVAHCRTRVLLAAALMLAVLTGALGMVRLERASATPADDAPAAAASDAKMEKPAPPATMEKAPTQSTPAKGTFVAGPTEETRENDQALVKKLIAEPLEEPQADGGILYRGVVVDKGTRQPLPGATVTVRRTILASYEWRLLEETKHTTDERGVYSFVVTPDQVANRLTYIELDAEHPDYAPRGGFGYALSMIMKNSKLGEPAFFALVDLMPAEPLTGRVIAPDGKPLVGVVLQGYSKADASDFREYGSFVRAQTAEDGTFRLNLTKGGPGIVWVVPEKHAMRQIVLDTKRGDWGDIQVSEGVGMTGRVLDAEGKPVANVWVTVSDEESQREITLPVASSMRRSGQADAEGRFEIGPVKPGKYKLEVDGYSHEVRAERAMWRQPIEVPCIFARRAVTIAADTAPLVVQAVPHVLFEGQIYDSKGAPKGGHEIMVFGKLDGEFYHTMLKPSPLGLIKGILPHGLEDAKLQFTSNEHGSLRHRVAKGQPLSHTREASLGTVNADVTGVEVVRYVSPIVTLKVVDEQGQVVKSAKIGAVYTDDDESKLMRPIDGLASSVFFEKQMDGRSRTMSMLPDQETRFFVEAEGFEKAEKVVTLAEGAQEEMTLVLKRAKDAQAQTSIRAGEQIAQVTASQDAKMEKADPPAAMKDQEGSGAAAAPPITGTVRPPSNATDPASNAAAPTALERLRALLQAPYEEPQPDGGILYRGVVIDQATRQPIAGAVVTVITSVSPPSGPRTREQITKHTSDERGVYSFKVDADYVKATSTYIEVEAEHADYAPKSRGGYALGMIMKNSKMGEPPFYSALRLTAAEPVTGRVVSPQGQPLADVHILGYSKGDAANFSDYGSFVRGQTAADGTFRLNLTKGGPGVFWVVPEKFAAKQIVLSERRGDLGNIEMTAGSSLRGQVLDADGMPVPNVWVNMSDEDSQRETGVQVATSMRRSDQADAEGRFELGPMKPGKYVMEISGAPSEIRYHTSERRPPVEVPAIFVRRTVTLGEQNEPLRIQAVPFVQVEGQYFNSKGATRSGHAVQVFGLINGEMYHTQLKPDAQGRIQGRLPHGLEDTRLSFSTIEHDVLRVRMGKDQPLERSRERLIGTVNSDIMGVEVVRYTAPIVMLSVVDEEGKLIADAKTAAIYTADAESELRRPVGNLPTSVGLRKQSDGRHRTAQMLPDEETRFVAEADGFERAEKTLKLPEGVQEELKLVLKRKQ